MNTKTLVRNGRICLVTAGCLVVISACGGSSSDGNTPQPETPVVLVQGENTNTAEVGVVAPLAGPTQPVPDDLAALNRVGLVINADSRCTVVGEDLNVSITRGLSDAEIAAGEPVAELDVTAYVSYTQDLGDSLELVSVTDNQATLTMARQDLTNLTVDLENGSVTAYFAGFAVDAPASVILRKPVPGGCLYAVRTPGYCATGLVRNASIAFEYEALSVVAEGCNLDNPGSLPVIELPAFIPADE